MCGQGVLPNELPVVGKNYQDPDGGIDEPRALNKLAVQNPQDTAAAVNPRPFREGVRSRSHPSEQRSPWLLFNGEEDEDVAYVYAFVRRTVILRLQVRPKFHEHRGLRQRVGPGPVFDAEGIRVDRTGEGYMC